MKINAMLCEFETHAKAVLPRNAWDFYSPGADQSFTKRENSVAFSRYGIRPCVLQGVSEVNLRVQLLGEWVESPVGVAPSAPQKLAHPDGEMATARACASLGCCMVLSNGSTVSMEDVAAGCDYKGLRWFQLYVCRDPEHTKHLIQRAETAGYKAIVVTVDCAVSGRRLAVARHRFTLPDHMSFENFDIKDRAHALRYLRDIRDERLDWSTIKWLRTITTLPIILKGILTKEDAEVAVLCGVQGIIVSNHGGRQLDYTPATVDALSEVIEAVDGALEVYMDGGVRRGTDVFKALALGARAVFVGRPALWGLAYDGQAGVEKILNILNNELKATMQATGCCDVSHVVKERLTILTDSSKL